MTNNYPLLISHTKSAFNLLNLLITLMMFNCYEVISQTLISPTGDGGFETGTTFAANGWTTSNGSANRDWYVGTGQTGYTGSRCAFIGNSSTAVGTNTSARIRHFYRSITVPSGATNIQLSFKYKQATADYISPTYYDYVAVYTSATAPTDGTLSTGSMVFGPYPNANVSTFTTQSVTLSNALAGTTTNLIFTFSCDAVSPHGYGAVDDISLTYTAAAPCTTPVTQPTTLVLTQPSNGTISGSFTAASPAPTNYLVVYNTTGTTPSPLNTTSYSIGGTVGSGNIVADNDANNSFSVSGLNPSTQYYFFVFSFNSGCAGGPSYLTASPLTGNATTPFFYCTATNPTNTIYYISGIATTGGVSNISNTGTGFSTGGYVDYSGTHSVSQVQGSSFSITATHPSSTYGYSVWVDWNNDGDFVDAGESVISTGYLSSPASVGSVTVPVATPAGNYRMRIRNAYLSNPPTACGSHDYGEVEDYKVTVIALAPCSTPTTQPTTLVLSSITATSVNGSFTAASPAPTGYLIVRSSSATPPTLTNGTTYAVGYTGLAPGTTYVIQGSTVNANSLSFSDTGLTSNTRYYYHIFSYNSSCTGAPFYLTTSPLTNNTVTCSAAPTSPVNSAITAISGTISWTASVAGGGIGTINYTLEVYTNAGYTTPISGSPFSVGTALTYNLTGLSSGTTYYYRIKANNGSCDSSYITNTLSTSITNNQCANAITLACATSNLSGTTIGAASFTHGTGCTMSNYGVWYKFTGDGNNTTISATTTSFDIKLSIASGSCGSLTNLACQDSALSNGTESYSLSTTVGVTYYVYIAYWYSAGTSTETGAFTISRTCTTPYNPCSTIPNIASCGSSTSITIPAGLGAYSTSACGWTTPGVEQIYTFTPATSGNYTISQSSSFDYINYLFKPVSSGCSSTGWTCIDAMLGADTSPNFALTGGIQYYILLDPEVSTGGGVIFTIGCPPTPMTNDECSGAIALTPVTTCSYTTYTNAGATASAGITAPGCASYSGGDVWFSVVVPATGEIDVDLQAGSMTDSGVAFYSGSCGSLTLLDCDDDSGAGLMSSLSRTGLTPGQTVYIRVWEYGNDNNGTFGLCVTTPSCPSPSDLLANILSTTSVTVNWTASSPPASGGYQYYVSTSSTPPTASTTPTGSTAAGVIGVTFTGLTPGLKYYFWVRSYCGGSDTSTWFGPTNYTPCAVGSGTGTTSLACPSILTGGVGLNGNNPPAVNCTASTCTNLEASFLQLNAPTNYTVSSIPYSPPYQFTCLQNPVSVNIDDVWSSTINLPFNFCFYGNNYNKCLIGSNGVITFDTSSNTPGGYSAWSFNTNLPSTSLFKNTIFGVYHDIDPSKGGQVGYELITLNTGCRALVASWNEIPMYSSACNSIYYTGMIVLYENTNVIEVYVKEKNLCATWNDGNAIIGLQNSAGTAAVVAPNRNGLDTNWAVTNEAWRFTPSGASLTSVQWYQGTVAAGTPISGSSSVTVGDTTTSTINVCPSTTQLYTAEVTYALCNGNLKFSDNAIVTVNGGKVWNGNTDTNWNVASNWTPVGVPTSADCVVIPDTVNDPIISGAPNAVGYNLSVYNNAQLTVNPSQNLTITDKVTVQSTGIFTLNNSASLIQINNVLNSGNITYQRTSPSVRTLDYVYWSSPVSNFDVNSIVSPYTFGAVYKWNTTITNSNGGWGTWVNAAGDTMIAGKGYIARTPGASPFNNSTYNPLYGSFTGVPNNGDITIPVERGPYQGAPFNGTNGVQITNLGDNWNLLGNPYPSAIRGSQFLFDNNTKIEGNIRLWTHGTLPSTIEANPFYGSYLSNYTPGDYLTYNFTGTSCCPAAGSDLFIGAGQGFFVQMIDGPAVAAAANVTVGFNNNLRSAAYSNSTFYKTQNYSTSVTTNVDNIERHRIWLDFIKTNGPTDRILFGYIENATMGRDSFYDCETQNIGATQIYSLIDNNKYSIQGRSLPFDDHDEVPLGINAPTQGEYTIGIVDVDGLFDNQNIYLKDELLSVTHNLKTAPYRFTTSAGEINDRFTIVYTDNTLAVPTQSYENDVRVVTNEEVTVSSSNLTMESIIVYNVLGQKLDNYEGINSNYIVLQNLTKNNITLMLKIKLESGEIVTRKINY